MKILVLGAGKMGRKIIDYLKNDFKISAADAWPAALDGLDVPTHLITNRGYSEAVHGHDAVISALYYPENISVASECARQRCAYFDLSEDVGSAAAINDLAERKDLPMYPQCGLAPGFVGIAARSLMDSFDKVDAVHLRVGALPVNPEGMLKYNLTWSTEGLINEYCKPCPAVVNHKFLNVPPLSELETLYIDDTEYEAFHTSGGLGSLYDNRLRELNYKTLRYPGHCELMRFLLKDCDFQNHQDELKELLERTVPTTTEDKVVIFVSVTGWVGFNRRVRKFVKTIYSKNGWTAIQLATAASVCAAVDMHFKGQPVTLDNFLNNRYGILYA